MKRKFGFTLVEVILASVVIAGFMATTVFTAGEISLARREALASTDRNTWANLQTQFAAEGVKAPSDNTNVWGSSAGEFGVIHAQGGSLYFTSTAEDLPADTVKTLGATGKSVSTSPFLLGLSTIAQRQNLHTTGLSLMDRQSYVAMTTVNNTPAKPSEPMEKPDSLFGFSTSLAVAYFDLTQGKWIVSPAQATLDALTQIDWTGGNAFYILAKATTGTISDMDCTLVGGAAGGGDLDLSQEYTPPFSTDYDRVYSVSFSSLQYYPGTSLTITSVSHDAKGGTSYGNASVTITPVTPHLVLDRVPDTTPGAAGSSASPSDVTIADVAHRPLYGETSYNLFRARLSYVNDPAHDLAWVRTNIPQILTHISIYRYFDSITSSSLGLDTLSSATGYTTFAANPDYFASGTSFKARIQNWDDSSLTIRPYSSLITRASASLDLNVRQSDLPRVTFNPAAGTYTTPVSVKMTASTPILATSANEKDASGVQIYHINYTTNGSNPTSSSDYVDSTGTIPSQITATTTVKAQALSYSGNLYAPFLKDSQANSAAYTIRDDDKKERLTVMKVKRIEANGNENDSNEGTLNGYVQGHIQVLEDDSFTLNGSTTIGLKLYTKYEPKIRANASTRVYNTEPTSFLTNEASLVGAHYPIPSPNPTKGVDITSTDGNSSALITVNNVPDKYTLIIIGDNTSTMDPAGDSLATYTLGTIQLKGKSGNALVKNTTNITDLKVNQDTNCKSLELSPGTYYYGIKLTEGAVLKLQAGGSYHFYSLSMSNGTQIQPLGSGVKVYIHDPNLTLEGSAKPTEYDSDGKIICRDIDTGLQIPINEDTDFTKVYVNLSGGCIIGTRFYPVEMHLTSYRNKAASTLSIPAISSGGAVLDKYIPYLDSWRIDFSARGSDGYFHYYSWASSSATTVTIPGGNSPDTTINGQFFGTILSNSHVQLGSCSVVGRIESYSINTNDPTYLFIKEW
jgi:type II secretory pathway pseudopilin PulG